MSTVKEIMGTQICPVGAILIDTGVNARVDGEVVAVFRLAGETPDSPEEIYAIDGVDPFTQVPVLSRGLVGSADGEPFVASPLYKQRFSLKTGQCLDDESVRLKTYETSVVDGAVVVSSSQAS